MPFFFVAFLAAARADFLLVFPVIGFFFGLILDRVPDDAFMVIICERAFFCTFNCAAKMSGDCESRRIARQESRVKKLAS